MKHMGQDERNRIEFMLGCGNNVAAIAKALGRSESTISRELLNRRIDSDKHYGRSNRLCARFDDCARTAFNGFRDIRRKNSPGCFESCPDFREAVCVRLNGAPYVWPRAAGALYQNPGDLCARSGGRKSTRACEERRSARPAPCGASPSRRSSQATKARRAESER